MEYGLVRQLIHKSILSGYKCEINPVKVLRVIVGD